jgi:hypothetical protein
MISRGTPTFIVPSNGPPESDRRNVAGRPAKSQQNPTLSAFGGDRLVKRRVIGVICGIGSPPDTRAASSRDSLIMVTPKEAVR